MLAHDCITEYRVPGLRRPLDHVGDVALIPELKPAVVVAVEGVPLSDAVVVDPPLVGHRDPDHSRRDQERPGRVDELHLERLEGEEGGTTG